MGQAPRTDLRKEQFPRVNNDLVSFFFVFFNVNARLLRLPRMRIKAATPPFLNLHVQSIACLIDKVVPILDKQPQFVIRAPCILARKIQMHRHHH